MLLEEASDDIQVDNYFGIKFVLFIINQALFTKKLILQLRMDKILQDSAHLESAFNGSGAQSQLFFRCM